MGRSLLQLPTELQSAIVSWLFRDGDISSVSLASKQLYQVAIPLLYHSMSLNVDHWKKEHIDCFLTIGHPGHRHVRSLCIDSDELDTEVRALKVAKDALQILPRNSLSFFRCPLEKGVDNDLLILLAATQRNLSFLGLGPLLRNALNIPDCLRPWPSSIETIVIPWRININLDIDFYQQLIERSSKRLKALTVRTENYRGPGERSPFFETSASEFLARGLFKNHGAGRDTPILELNDLNFQNQDLSTASTTWCRFIDFARLRTLQIWNCEHVDNLLSVLQQDEASRPVQLHGLVLSFENTEQAPRQVQEFIRSIRGLQYLNLCYAPEKPEEVAFSIHCLEAHKHTIKDLYLGVGSNYRLYPSLHVLSTESLRWLSSQCLKLSQLAIALPPICFTDALRGRWGLFGSYLKLLASLPKLKFLRLLTWPVIDDRQFDHLGDMEHRQAQQKLYLKYLDIVATCIARIFAHQRGDHHYRLSVITFGSAERRDVVTRVGAIQDHLFDGPIMYKVRRKQTEFGMITKAKRIDARLMEYEEPIAYVVDEDTDQGLSLESYSWGSGSG